MYSVYYKASPEMLYQLKTFLKVIEQVRSRTGFARRPLSPPGTSCQGYMANKTRKPSRSDGRRKLGMQRWYVLFKQQAIHGANMDDDHCPPSDRRGEVGSTPHSPTARIKLEVLVDIN